MVQSSQGSRPDGSMPRQFPRVVQGSASRLGTGTANNGSDLSRWIADSEQKIWQKVCVHKVAAGLGMFSIGLGLSELLAPRVMARIAGGQGKHPTLVRLFGLREITSGLAIFAQGSMPAGGVWSRVLGDAIDLVALASIFACKKSNKAANLFAMTNVLAVTAMDVLTAIELSKRKGTLTDDGFVHVKQSLFINRSPAEVYKYWHNFEKLPSFMRHVVSVSPKAGDKYHWVVKAAAGTTVEWDAEITEDRPNEKITWQSLPGTPIMNTGTVSFIALPADRGTLLEVEIFYRPPMGIVGAQVGKLFREEPTVQLKDDLRRFKQIVETGEIIRSDSSPDGNGNIFQRPAQPVGNGDRR